MIKRILNLFKARDSTQLYQAYCIAYNHTKVADDIYQQYKLNGGINHAKCIRTI